MKIRTQLIIAIAAFGLALVIIAGFVAVTNQQVDHLNAQGDLAKKIETEANDLSYLSSDYVLYPDSQQAELWRLKDAALTSDLAAIDVDTPEEKALLSDLMANHKRLITVFDDVQSGIGIAREGNLTMDPVATRVSWNRLSVQIQGIVSDSSYLSQLLRDETDRVKSLSNVLISLLLVMFSLLVLTSYLIIYRRTLSSISELSEGAKVIGSGDLSHTIPEKGDDEISDLVRVVNKMTVNLRNVTASKTDLEREIAVRKKAEEELGEINEELNATNEELAATQEELHQNLDEITRSERNLRESEAKFRSLIEGVRDYAIIMLDPAGKVSSWNSGAERIAGYTASEIIGKDFVVFLPPEESEDHDPHEELRIAAEKGRFESRGWKVRKDGSRFWAEILTTPLWDDQHRLIGFSKIFRDLTDRKNAEETILKKNEELGELNEELTASQEELHQNLDELTTREKQLNEALAEKEILLSEIHHRVKNNLTAFISLLSLEGSTEETPAGLELKNELQNRARSMALIHETLYKTHQFSSVDMDAYLTPLVDQVVNSYSSPQSIKTVVEAKGIDLDLARATPIGLIVNELVTNSLKHAFPQGGKECRAGQNDPCTIGVRLVKEDGSYLLSVYDNGVGLPAGFDPTTAKTLGLKLVTFLAKHQVRAKIEVKSDKGTEFVFRFRE